MVALARQLLTDPFTVKKTREGREREIIRCNRCNECGARLFEHRELVCTLNPVSGREAYWGEGSLKRVPEADQKHIVVIGGGPAGMKAAAVAARRGHAVTLLERADKLGGHLRVLEQLPGMTDWAIAIDNLEREVENAGVEVRCGIEVTRQSLQNIEASSVVVATGAAYERTGLSLYRPEREEIPGAELPHVLDVGTATGRPSKTPRRSARACSSWMKPAAICLLPWPRCWPRQEERSRSSAPACLPANALSHLDIMYIFPRLSSWAYGLPSNILSKRSVPAKSTCMISGPGQKRWKPATGSIAW